jgi:hypothetical protein
MFCLTSGLELPQKVKAVGGFGLLAVDNEGHHEAK